MSALNNARSWPLVHGAQRVLVLSGIALLAGCAVQARVYGPPPIYVAPPPPVYVAPPPPPPPVVSAAVIAPGVEVSLTASEPPPPLPDYEQPPCPEDGYLWTPGYWHYGAGGYFWVPGTWVEPPQVGLLWTPGYWAFAGGVYGFRAGYWGPHIGFYGGVNYGFGYVGVGFAGGRWAGGHFAYNTAVNNVNTTVIHNTYNQTVVNNNVTVNKVSYNGGAGGVAAAPSAQERAAAQETHVPPTAAQSTHVQQAGRNPALFAHANGGHPAIAATARPGAFSGPGVISAHGAPPTSGSPGMQHGATPPAAGLTNQTHTPPGTQNNVAHPQTTNYKQPPKPQDHAVKRPPPKPKPKPEEK
jgi:WXXGXW repeat (2 copies)